MELLFHFISAKNVAMNRLWSSTCKNIDACCLSCGKSSRQQTKSDKHRKMLCSELKFICITLGVFKNLITIGNVGRMAMVLSTSPLMIWPIHGHTYYFLRLDSLWSPAVFVPPANHPHHWHDIRRRSEDRAIRNPQQSPSMLSALFMRRYYPLLIECVSSPT